MMPPAFNSLKSRLLLSMLGVVLLTVALVSVTVVGSQRDVAYRQAEAELRSLGGMLAINTTAALLFGDSFAAQRSLEGFSSLPDIRVAVVFDALGEVFARVGPRPPPEKRLTAAEARNLMFAVTPTLRRSERGLYAFIPVSSEGELIGLVLLVNGMDGLSSRLQEFTTMVALVSLLAFAIGTVIILWLQRYFTRPLQQTVGVIQQITADRDYSRRTPNSDIEEFATLSSSFNHMIAEVETRGRQLEQVNSELETRVRQRTEDLESALQLANEGNRAKSAFLAVMSHEVRTPLNAIIGFLEVLKTRPLEAATRHLVGSLDLSAQTLLELLNEILDFSKLDANRIELDCQEVDLRELLSSALETFRPLAERKGLRLELDCRVVEGPVLGDRTRLRQILHNLISNAVKFTETGWVRVSAEAQDHHSDTLVSFRVADSGIGIRPESLGELCTPFVQGDSSITRKYGGTGLGLAISRQLIRLMDGSFGVDSVPGQGSCFWFTLPLTRPSLRSDPPLAELQAQAGAQRPGRILVAEDNPLNQEVLLSLLALFSHRCDVATTGVEALRLAGQDAYDLILLDYHMPEMDGLEACRRIRELGSASPNALTPIVALTADIQPQVNKDFRRAGANGTLLKPFTLVALRSCLEQWLPVADAPHSAALPSAVPAAEEAPLFNPRSLDEVIGLSPQQGAELFERLAGIFREQLPALAEQIRQAAAQADAAALFRAAHALKSSAANIGAERLAALARQLEQPARDGGLPETALVEQLSACAVQSLDALLEALQGTRSQA